MNIEILNWDYHGKGTKDKSRRLEEMSQLGLVIHIYMEISQGNSL
jgi:hypothetical protein